MVQIYYLGEKPGRTGTIEQDQACGYMWGRETEIMLYKVLEDFQVVLFIIMTFMWKRTAFQAWLVRAGQGFWQVLVQIHVWMYVCAYVCMVLAWGPECAAFYLLLLPFMCSTLSCTFNKPFIEPYDIQLPSSLIFLDRNSLDRPFLMTHT